MKSRVTSHLLTNDKSNIICGRRGGNVGQNLNLTVINKLQSIPWEINEDILDSLHDVLKEPETEMTSIEINERVNSFKLRDIETTNTIDYLLENGNQFYFGWKYDTRGRSYSQGYHINPQGNEYRKAMLNFHNKEVLNDYGKQYLKIDIANCMGYDKETWVTRIAKANAIIKDIFANPTLQGLKITAYANQADTPLLFRKAINTWHKGVILGQPVGHNMGLDGTASGLQFMSALSGCCTTATNSNVHAKVEREYTEEVATRIAELEAELASL